MTDNNTSSETPTRKEKPEKWAGPSFAVWTYNQRWKEQGRAGLFIAGYYKNLVDWERHDHHSSFSLLEESGELSNFALSEIEHSDYTLIEKDEDNEYDKTSKLLRNILFLNQTTVKEAYDFGIEGRDPSMLVTDRTVEAILSKIPVFDSISPSDNRLPKLPEPLEGYELLDLAATDFSNKSDADTAISFCRRRCRLLIGPKVTLCVWESPIPEDTVNWEPSLQRWPNHGIPAFNYQIKIEKGPLSKFHRLRLPFSDIPEGLEDDHQFRKIAQYIVPMAIIERIVINEDLGLRFAFKTNLELLQNSMFKMLGKPNKSAFKDIEERYNLLYKYLGMARENNTRLQRRLAVSRLKPYLEEKSSYFTYERSLREIIENIDKQISKEYGNLLKLAKFIMILKNKLRSSGTED